MQASVDIKLEIKTKWHLWCTHQPSHSELRALQLSLDRMACWTHSSTIELWVLTSDFSKQYSLLQVIKLVKMALHMMASAWKQAVCYITSEMVQLAILLASALICWKEVHVLWVHMVTMLRFPLYSNCDGQSQKLQVAIEQTCESWDAFKSIVTDSIRVNDVINSTINRCLLALQQISITQSLLIDSFVRAHCTSRLRCVWIGWNKIWLNWSILFLHSLSDLFLLFKSNSILHDMLLNSNLLTMRWSCNETSI